MILSVRHDGKLHNIAVNSDTGENFWFEGHREKSIDQLVQWHMYVLES